MEEYLVTGDEVVVRPHPLPRCGGLAARGDLCALVRIGHGLAIAGHEDLSGVVGEDDLLSLALGALDARQVIEDATHLSAHHPVELRERFAFGGVLHGLLDPVDELRVDGARERQRGEREQ